MMERLLNYYYYIYIYNYNMLIFGINWSMKCAPRKTKYATQWQLGLVTW